MTLHKTITVSGDNHYPIRVSRTENDFKIRQGPAYIKIPIESLDELLDALDEIAPPVNVYRKTTKWVPGE